jgi:hypothetical protein
MVNAFTVMTIYISGAIFRSTSKVIKHFFITNPGKRERTLFFNIKILAGSSSEFESITPEAPLYLS